MDSLDQYIQGVVTKEIYEPENYIRTIQNSLDTNDRHHKYFNLYKVAIIVICLLCTSGIAYATYNYVKNNFNRRKGIETAINNGYIMNVDGEPVTSNDVSLKINQILLDDYNLDISFGLEFKNMEIPDNIQAIEFENILIADENNNILYHSGSRDIFDKFVKSNNLDFEYKDYNEKYINASSSNKFNFQDKNSINLIYNILNTSTVFPKCTTINIYATNVSIHTSSEKYSISTDFIIKQSIATTFENRNSINYIVKDNQFENILNLEMITYPTGTNIKIKINTSDEITKQDNLKNLIEQAIEEKASNTFQTVDINGNTYVTETERKLYMENEYFYNSIRDIYIQNSLSDRFYVTSSVNTISKIYRSQENHYLLYCNTLDMTTYNCTDIVTLHFTYNNTEYNIDLYSN